MEDSSTWMRKPEQQRSRDTLRRIFDVTETLLVQGGVEGASLTEIIKQANTSTGAFYSRFRNKAGLFYALHERFLADAKRYMDQVLSEEAIEKLTLLEIVERIVSGNIALYRAHPGILKAAYYLTRMNRNADFLARSRIINEALVDRVSALILGRRDEIRHPDPDAAARFLVTLLSSTLRETIVFEAPGLDKPHTDVALAEEMTRVLGGYLGLSHG